MPRGSLKAQPSAPQAQERAWRLDWGRLRFFLELRRRSPSCARATLVWSWRSADQRNFDLTRREADLALRMGRPRDAALVTRKLSDADERPPCPQFRAPSDVDPSRSFPRRSCASFSVVLS